MLKKVIRLNLDDLLLYLGIEGGVFLLTQIIIGAVMVVAKPMDGILISGITLPVIAGILALLSGVVHVTVTFEQALCFGQTRRRALALTMGVMTFEGVCALGAAALLALMERYLGPPIWASLAGRGHWVVDYPGDWGVLEDCLVLNSFQPDWRLYPVILLIGLGGGLVGGALIQRFGTKGAWALWGVWMAGCFVPEMLGREVFAIGDWNQYTIGAGVVLGIGCLAWSLWSLFHAVVKA
ncbi:hypothetical protein ACTQ4E_14130 [Lawsonibacter sp. LCP25S3_G6]|uniref:hypothetical protein n=1 Tax=unclassified Lawsonibacter TaxID=2617946 RepID=UPI003F983764